MGPDIIQHISDAPDALQPAAIAAANHAARQQSGSLSDLNEQPLPYGAFQGSSHMHQDQDIDIADANLQLSSDQTGAAHVIYPQVAGHPNGGSNPAAARSKQYQVEASHHPQDRHTSGHASSPPTQHIDYITNSPAPLIPLGPHRAALPPNSDSDSLPYPGQDEQVINYLASLPVAGDRSTPVRKETGGVRDISFTFPRPAQVPLPIGAIGAAPPAVRPSSTRSALPTGGSRRDPGAIEPGQTQQTPKQTHRSSTARNAALSSRPSEQSDTMAAMGGDLAILSAEKYDISSRFSSTRQAASKTSRQASVSSDAPPPRKRGRPATADMATAHGEERKGKRGRPRLETQDETAQDRRRTQIRNAQRAYRGRKESKLDQLAKQVKDLADTNDQMHNTFRELFDAAMAAGVIDSYPEFGAQLQKVTERFVSFARRSSDDESQEETAAHNSDDDPRISARTAELPPPYSGSNQSAGQQPTAWGGLFITHEPSQDDEVMQSSVAPATAPRPKANDWEWVTYPTAENASFPISSMPMNTTMFSFTSTQSILPNISTPQSLSHLETTFGRRLQRRAVEAALKLSMTPSPDPLRFTRVFGFCMLFEPIENIQKRLRMAINRPVKESMDNWAYPFVHLGGAGTHYDKNQVSAGGRLIGKQGTVEVLKPKHNTGFSIGPFEADIEAAKDNLLGKSMRMLVPGFQGAFQEPEEVENYLLKRGVVIEPGRDYITVDIDPNEFVDPDPPSPGLYGRLVEEPVTNDPTTRFDMTTPFMAGGGPHVDSAMGTSVAGGSSAASGDFTPPTSIDTQDNALAAWGGGRGVEPQGSALMQIGDFTSGSGVYGFPAAGEAAAVANKKRLILDVDHLVQELVNRAVCLGRTPAFRERDVNAAFWTATRDAQDPPLTVIG